jgi:ElaB/YqjD/DUF883 family membrane-anchored ribosome-binding protein
MEHSTREDTSRNTVGSSSKDNSRAANGVLESVSRGRDAIGSAANEAITAAGPDLQALRDDLNSLKDTVTKFFSQAGNEAAKSAREVSSSVAHQVGGVATDLTGRSAELASAATDQAKNFATEFEATVRKNPLGALTTAVLLGAFIGLMGRRG